MSSNFENHSTIIHKRQIYGQVLEYTNMQNGSFVVLFKDSARQEVFLVFRSDYPIWGITGGGIENGETSEQAAVREAFEETGFEVKILRKVGVYENGLAKTHLFEGRVIKGDFKPEFPGCRGAWFKVDNLPKDMTHRAKEKVQDVSSCFDKTPFVKKIQGELISDNLILVLRHPCYLLKYLTNQIVTH